jgi:hypothetical protein
MWVPKRRRPCYGARQYAACKEHQEKVHACYEAIYLPPVVSHLSKRGICWERQSGYVLFVIVLEFVVISIIAAMPRQL